VKARPITAKPVEKKETLADRRPSTAKPASGSQLSYKPLETGEFEDPIAQAINSRQAIGGTYDAVIKDTDARKLGVQLVKTFKLTAAKGPDLIELIA